MHVSRILELGAYIYQMQWHHEMRLLLIASASNKNVICSTTDKTFTSIDKKCGKLGACFQGNKQLLTPPSSVSVVSVTVQNMNLLLIQVWLPKLHVYCSI